MGITNYQQLLEEVITPKITDTVFNKNYEQFESIFTKDTVQSGGEQIIDTIETSVDSTARNFDRNDVDPNGGSFVTAQGKWDKLYQDVAFEIHNIDIIEAQNGGATTVSSLFENAAARKMRDLSQLWWTNLMATLKADIDDTGAYSDASLSRSTYPTLASTVNDTDTAITLAIMRTMSNAVRLNKNTGGKSMYTWILESQVYEKFEPLAAALHTWNVTGSAGTPIDAGYQPIGNFEGSDVISPEGMTTGDGFFLRTQDVLVRNNRPLTMEQVPSGRDSVKVIMKAGVTSRVVKPGIQGKLENKD